MKLAIIGGTGASSLAVFDAWNWTRIETKYGIAEYAYGRIAEIDAFFLPRHGRSHSVLPHLINYQAVVAAVAALEIPMAVGIAAVGSLRENMPPGSFAVMSDFIDLTKKRQSTFFDTPESPVVHTDFTHPYCPNLSAQLTGACEAEGNDTHSPCVYLCTDGPRYETPAEIQTFKSWGADVVGMTNVPEVVLAREAGICYAGLAVVTNYAAGISPTPLSHQEVVDLMHRKDEELSSVISVFAGNLTWVEGCNCRGNSLVFNVELHRT